MVRLGNNGESEVDEGKVEQGTRQQQARRRRGWELTSVRLGNNGEGEVDEGEVDDCEEEDCDGDNEAEDGEEMGNNNGEEHSEHDEEGFGGFFFQNRIRISFMVASSSLDLSMPSFRLLSDSDENQPKPHLTQKSLSKRKRSIAALKRHVDPLPSSSSDTDPSWNFWKKYLGGEHLPDGIEWGSDLEEDSSDLESSFNTDEI
ncbi:unnamed protein product [Cuscuta campestris]|uniref:Uncharacterized protein n=1 Tax=Cuscuta campestris TaxID=132261 RepID=A0A484KK62_9ASTE|nr:unnamed protein product [Cuscuta campestris]